MCIFHGSSEGGDEYGNHILSKGILYYSVHWHYSYPFLQFCGSGMCLEWVRVASWWCCDAVMWCDAMCAQWPCDVMVVMRCVVTQCVMSGVAIAMWWRNVATSCGMRGYLPWYVRDVGNASVSFGRNACIVCSCGWLWFIWWYFFPVQYYILIWWYPDSAVMGSPVDTVKMLIPATIYAIQNNLLFIALSNLNATSYPFCCRGEVFFSLLYAIQTPFHPFEFFTTPPLLESSFIFIFVKCSLLLV